MYILRLIPPPLTKTTGDFNLLIKTLKDKSFSLSKNGYILINYISGQLLTIIKNMSLFQAAPVIAP